MLALVVRFIFDWGIETIDMLFVFRNTRTLSGINITNTINPVFVNGKRKFALKNIGPLLDDKLKAKRRSHNKKPVQGKIKVLHNGNMQDKRKRSEQYLHTNMGSQIIVHFKSQIKERPY